MKRGFRPPPGAQAARSPSIAARFCGDRRPDGQVSLCMRVEQQARPVRRRQRSRDEMGNRDGIVDDQRLLLRGESCLEPRVARAAHLDREAALRDPRSHDDGDVERLRSELGEPEPELLDEVEREAVMTWGPRREHRRLELDALARSNDVREAGPLAVPHDRVAERIEPVVRELDTLAAARAPGRRPGVLEPQTGARRHSGTLLAELVRMPANRERPDRNRVLADSLHSAAYSGGMQVGEISVEGVSRSFRVHAREARTLKDLVVQRGESHSTDVWALNDVRPRWRRRGGRPDRPQRLGQDDAPSRRRRDHQADGRTRP